MHGIFKTSMCRWVNLYTDRGLCGTSLSVRFVSSIFFSPFWCLLDWQMTVQVKEELFCKENFLFLPPPPKYINKKCDESKVLGPLMEGRKPVS